jgi:hypothetical protein
LVHARRETDDAAAPTCALVDTIKESDFVAWIAPVVKSIAKVTWLE